MAGDSRQFCNDLAVKRAKAEADRLGLTSIGFGVADMREVDRAVDGTFDIVLSFDNSLPHLLRDEDLEKALRAILNKLKPGGWLAASIRDYDRILAAALERTGFERVAWLTEEESGFCQPVVVAYHPRISNINIH